MKRLFLLSALMVLCSAAWANYVCRGSVFDKQGEPLIGATVAVPGTSTATAVDIDGNFSLSVPDNTKDLKISYVGFQDKTVKAQPEIGRVVLDSETTMLQDVVVTQSVAKTRKTPVAVSTVDAPFIEAKLGSQEFPEVLKTTPGVWATKDGGGYGDAKINMRGFKSTNVAQLVNGVPVNDMEWGGVYWSNWSGLSDVTSSMQTQRGLGAAIISTPSVGGTLNITTKSLDAKRGGTVFYGMGNDNMNHIGFSASTGLMKNGWAITLMGSRKWGDGYIQGTRFDAFTWFVNISKKINDNHQLSLTAFGSPQDHWKRDSNNGLTIEGWQNVKNYMDGESMYRYNPTFGYRLNGQAYVSNQNHFHKPQISLNHIWQIDFKSSLSTAVYLSIANGYGTSGQGRTSDYRSQWYGASNGVLSDTWRCDDGTFDYAAIEEMNAASTTGSNMVMAHSINNHTWVGLVSTYKNELIENHLNLLVGLDVRYYAGLHQTKISDLFNGQYYVDDSSRKNVLPANNSAAADPNWQYQKLGVGDIVYRDYTGYVAQEGLYAQLEYTCLEDDKLNVFLGGSINNNSDWLVNRFYYDKAHQRSETLNFLAGNVKAGINYNIDRHNNVFANGGFISRAPFMSAAFLSREVSNAANPNALNEKCVSAEIGYEFHSPKFTAQINGYFTRWMDQTMVKTNTMQDGTRYVMNMSGVASRHMGVEVAATYKPFNWLEFSGMFSYGDWINDSNTIGYFYNSESQPLANLSTGAIASGIMAEDHLWAKLNTKGRKVGGSAQTTGALSMTVKPLKGWRIGVDWVASARNYSDYTITGNNLSTGQTMELGNPWEIPWGNQLDLSASYSFKLGGLNATVYGNVNNLCNYNYIMDAYTSATSDGTWQNAYRVFYSFGRTYSLRLKLTF
ncbi:MAG: carboxypeptidase-like regulatory domain-containing protein [Muribaculaceae bacterium]|nr:carboxypeptidase-like regulatory domain-containing protein [Muribaculaceae bacterium]